MANVNKFITHVISINSSNKLVMVTTKPWPTIYAIAISLPAYWTQYRNWDRTLSLGGIVPENYYYKGMEWSVTSSPQHHILILLTPVCQEVEEHAIITKTSFFMVVPTHCSFGEDYNSINQCLSCVYILMQKDDIHMCNRVYCVCFRLWPFNPFFPVLFLFDWVGVLWPQLSKVLKLVH